MCTFVRKSVDRHDNSYAELHGLTDHLLTLPLRQAMTNASSHLPDEVVGGCRNSVGQAVINP